MNTIKGVAIAFGINCASFLVALALGIPNMFALVIGIAVGSMITFLVLSWMNRSRLGAGGGSGGSVRRRIAALIRKIRQFFPHLGSALMFIVNIAWMLSLAIAIGGLIGRFQLTQEEWAITGMVFACSFPVMIYIVLWKRPKTPCNHCPAG